MALSMLADEDFDGRIVRGLLRHSGKLHLTREPDVGLSGRSDDEVLDWAATHGHVVISHDISTMPPTGWQRVRDGLPMAGLIVASKRLAISIIIEELQLIAESSDHDDWVNQVRFLPLL